MQSEKQTNDCISREAAIDALWEIRKEEIADGRRFKNHCSLSTDVDVIRDLPSAQPVGTLLHDSGTDYAHGYADGYKQGKAESEIVRCKNCKLFGEPKCLMYFDGYDWAEPDGYCHMAERREE